MSNHVPLKGSTDIGQHKWQFYKCTCQRNHLFHKNISVLINMLLNVILKTTQTCLWQTGVLYLLASFPWWGMFKWSHYICKLGLDKFHLWDHKWNRSHFNTYTLFGSRISWNNGMLRQQEQMSHISIQCAYFERKWFPWYKLMFSTCVGGPFYPSAYGPRGIVVTITSVRPFLG